MPRTRGSLADINTTMEEDPASPKSDPELLKSVSCVVCYEPFINPNYDTKAPKWQLAISRVFYKALSIPPIINDDDDDDEEEDSVLSLPYCPGCHTKISVMYTLYSQLESIQSQYATLRNEIAFSVVESINNGSDGNSPVDQIRRQVYARWKEYHCTESAREDYRTCYGLDAIIPGGVVGMSEVTFDEDEELTAIKLSDLKNPDPYEGSDEVEFSDLGVSIDEGNRKPNNGDKLDIGETLAENGISDVDDGEDSALEKENESLSNGNEVVTNGRKRSISIRRVKARVASLASPSRRARLTPPTRKLQNTAVKRNSRGSIRVKSEPSSPPPIPVPMEVPNPEVLSPIMNESVASIVTEDIKPLIKRRLPDGFGSPSKVGRGRAGMRRSAGMKRDQPDDIDKGTPDEVGSPVAAIAIKRELSDDVDLSQEVIEKGHHSEQSFNDHPFACYVCKKGFGNSTGLGQHISMVHPSEREYQCADCNIGFSGRVTYLRHMKKHEVPIEELAPPATAPTPPPVLNKKHPCPVCKKVFLKKTSMIIHKKIHAKTKVAIKIPTLKQGKISIPPALKKQRSRKNTTPRASPGPPSLEVEGTVAEANPEECQICFKTFQFPHLLKAHMVTHTKKPEAATKP